MARDKTERQRCCSRSFNFPKRKENDMVWAREVEERINAYERGDIHSSPSEDVFKRIERNLGK